MKHTQTPEDPSSSSPNSSSSTYKLAALKHQAWNPSRAHRLHGGHLYRSSPVTQNACTWLTLQEQEHKVDLFRAVQQKKKKDRKAFQRNLRLFRIAESSESDWGVCGFGQFNIQHPKYLHKQTWQNELRALGTKSIHVSLLPEQERWIIWSHFCFSFLGMSS